jgi:hypothetical protein
MRSVGAVPLRTEQMCCRTDRGFGLRGCGLAGFQAVCERLEYLGIHAPVKSERANEQGAVSFIQKMFGRNERELYVCICNYVLSFPCIDRVQSLLCPSLFSIDILCRVSSSSHDFVK